MANKGELGRLLATIMPLYANYKPPASEAESAILVNAWHSMVGHLDADVLALAFRAAATRSEFFPTPALVLACAVELTTTPSRSGAEAWGDVTGAIEAHHWNHPPNGKYVQMAGNYYWEFQDKIVARLVDAFGWANLCASDNVTADRARFIQAYEQERDKAQREARLPLPAGNAAKQLTGGTTPRTEVSARAVLGAVTERMTR